MEIDDTVKDTEGHTGCDELKVKAEYLRVNKRKAEDASVEDNNGENKKIKTNDGEKYKKRNRRGKKDVGLGQSYTDLCRIVSQGKVCNKKDCNKSHSVETYLSKKPKDIGECYVFKTTGSCPDGFNCRFGDIHIDKENKTLITKPPEECKPFESEINTLNYDLIVQLRKKNYDFQYGSLSEKEIKPLDYKNKVYIAPLTTVGNLPFRRICVDYGADITTGEMAVCYNLLKGQASEWALLRRHPSEKIFGVQIAGANANALKEIGDVIRREVVVDFVDLNAGCPIDAINKIGCGAALLQRPVKLQTAVESLLTGLKEIPLILKTRISWDREPILHSIVGQLPLWKSNNNINHISGLVIHGRSRAQRYSKKSDWEYISKCAQLTSIDIPVIGNGDIYNYKDYYNNTSLSGISGAMIGRGVLIKPWLPTEIKEQRDWDISASERFDILKRFVNYGLEHWGSDQRGVDNCRRYLLEWLSFLCRYVPIGILDQPCQSLNQRIPSYIGRNDLETLLGSNNNQDWIKITEMLLGPVNEDFTFVPKHISSSTSNTASNMSEIIE